MEATFKSAAGDYLRVVGSDGVYHGFNSGDVTLDASAGTGVVIERDVLVGDGEGVYVRRAMATVKSGLVKPHTGDWISIGTDRWEVESAESDDGFLMRLFVRPKL